MLETWLQSQHKALLNLIFATIVPAELSGYDQMRFRHCDMTYDQAFKNVSNMITNRCVFLSTRILSVRCYFAFIFFIKNLGVFHTKDDFSKKMIAFEGFLVSYYT